MSLRARIFIIVSILVLLILGISIFLVVRNKNKNTAATTSPTAPANNAGVIGQTGGTAATGTQVPAGVTAKTPSPLEAQKNGVEQLAKVFVERYGTYSTDNEFQNIKDVQTFVTKSLWPKISANMNTKTTSQNFTGVTTKVISVNLTSWSDAKATVELKTSRTEEKNGVVTARYQNAVVELVKENNVWLVDKLIWN